MVWKMNHLGYYFYMNYNSIYKAANRHYLENGSLGHGCHTLIAIAVDSSGIIIAKGTNSYSKTHPVQADYAKKIGKHDAIYLHAEIAALVKCRRDPHMMFVFRFNKKGEPVLAKPCPICSLAMKEAGIKKVVYTTNDGMEEENI